MTTVQERATYRILLVEDDDGDALLVEELLHDCGLPFELTITATLAAARTELAGGPVDCILLDLHLPDVSGTTGSPPSGRSPRTPR